MKIGFLPDFVDRKKSKPVMQVAMQVSKTLEAKWSVW